MDWLASADRTLVYTYYSELDGMGHRYGVDSDAWRGQLMVVDRLAQRLAEQLPPRSALYVTADHGMIDIAPEQRIDFDQDAELRAGVALLGGVGRARPVSAVPNAEGDVFAVWSERLGDRMWVATRDQAIAQGWFGPVVEDRVYQAGSATCRPPPGTTWRSIAFQAASPASPAWSGCTAR